MAKSFATNHSPLLPRPRMPLEGVELNLQIARRLLCKGALKAIERSLRRTASKENLGDRKVKQEPPVVVDLVCERLLQERYSIIRPPKVIAENQRFDTNSGALKASAPGL